MRPGGDHIFEILLDPFPVERFTARVCIQPGLQWFPRGWSKTSSLTADI